MSWNIDTIFDDEKRAIDNFNDINLYSIFSTNHRNKDRPKLNKLMTIGIDYYSTVYSLGEMGNGG